MSLHDRPGTRPDRFRRPRAARSPRHPARAGGQRTTWARLAVTGAAAILVGVTGGAPAHATQTIADGVLGLPGREGVYDYAPSMMVDGATLRVWWCGQGSGGVAGDSIYHSSLTAGGTWTVPQPVVVPGPAGSWDGVHACDPSVVKGTWVDPLGDGVTYTYALYYTGTNHPSAANSVGVAFSNDGVAWTKHPTPVITAKTTDGVQYGAGMPSAHRSGTDDVTIAFLDSSDPRPDLESVNMFVQSADGVNFAPTRTHFDGPHGYAEHIGDIAFDPVANVWNVATKSGDDRMVHLYTTAGPNLTDALVPTGSVSPVSTGQSANHNPGYLRSPEGDLHREAGTGYRYVAYGSGANWQGMTVPDAPGTWDIRQSRVFDAWEFDADGNTQGWTLVNAVAPTTPVAGYWTFNGGADVQLVGPAMELDAAGNSTVEITSANQSAVQDGRVYFTTAADPAWSQAKSVPFTSTNGGGWFTHAVDMSVNPAWTGTVTAIRVDLAGDGGGAAMGVDRIATR
jgi:hypothetical protein